MTESIRNAPISTWLALGTALVAILGSHYQQDSKIAVLQNEINHLNAGDDKLQEQLVRVNEKLDAVLEAVMIQQRYRAE